MLQERYCSASLQHAGKTLQRQACRAQVKGQTSCNRNPESVPVFCTMTECYVNLKEDLCQDERKKKTPVKKLLKINVCYTEVLYTKLCSL